MKSVIFIEKIHTSAWESKDGEYGQFLINYNTEPVKCKICLPDGEYRLYKDEDTYCIICGGCQELEIERLSVVMLEKVDL